MEVQFVQAVGVLLSAEATAEQQKLALQYLDEVRAFRNDSSFPFGSLATAVFPALFARDSRPFCVLPPGKRLIAS